MGPASFDVLEAIVPWVEQGKAPARILASQTEGGNVIRTRPLCRHPEAARYEGQGSSGEAANFECAK